MYQIKRKAWKIFKEIWQGVDTLNSEFPLYAFHGTWAYQVINNYYMKNKLI
jgi:hypothetical protein